MVAKLTVHFVWVLVPFIADLCEGVFEDGLKLAVCHDI